MKNRAFSLVELSIVLVILGLLAGGILSGQSLIRAAGLRSITTQSNQYMVALQSFRDKYFAIPGDMNNATKFWTSAGGTGADSTCFDKQTSGSKATCDGTGDGRIKGITGSTYEERYSAWKHLANAGLIEGSYTGKTEGASGTAVTKSGVNVPAGKIGGIFDIYYELSAADGNPYVFSGSSLNRNTITLYSAKITPSEVWNIDTKLDDGSPVYGLITTNKKSATVAPDCATGDDDKATYDFASSVTTCLLRLGV